METQRNRIINNLDKEFDFISEIVKDLGSAFRNYAPPSGKHLKETHAFGKTLIKLYDLWTKLKDLEVKKAQAEHLQEIRLFTYIKDEYEKQANKNAWGKLHNKQLDIGMKYLKLKKKLEKMNDGYGN